MRFLRLAALTLAVFPGTAFSQTAATISSADYDRSAQFLPWNRSKLILNDDINPIWIDGTQSLWYKVSSESGWQFMIAEPATGARRPAFDHRMLAKALSVATGTAIDGDHLGISELAWPNGLGGPVRFRFGAQLWSCSEAACAKQATDVKDPTRAYAPGGRYAVFAKGFDLSRIDLRTGEERALTTDGTKERPYAAVAGVGGPVSRQMMGIPVAPIGDFSPDGRIFLTYRLDETQVPPVTLIRNAPTDPTARAETVTFRAAFAGDTPATATLILIDLETGTVTPVAHPPTRAALQAPVAFAELRWSADSRSFYFSDYADTFREKALFRGDAATGQVTKLFTDRATTNQYSFTTPPFELLRDGGVLWPSERSGWQHLYRYDRDGRLRNPVTRGAWAVREIIDVDETRGTVMFSAGGRESGDPCLRRVYTVPLTGGMPRLLTPEDADHAVRVGSAQMQRLGSRAVGPSAFSTDRRWFIDSFSRIDVPTRTVVREADGRVAMTLETARHSTATPPFDTPEPFVATAADGVTKIYGVLMKPVGFDPAKRYPVIDSMYAGPQSIYVPKQFGGELLGPYGRGLTELGFVVFMVDGRGLPFRSRAFQDASYGKLQTAGFLVDHIAALRQVAATRPWLDLTRVGAFGLSAGGYGVVRALLDHPDFYKVGVATSPYDPVQNDVTWLERFQGTAKAADALPAGLSTGAERLRGKLLLMTGDLDDIAVPSGTLRLADALIRKNKTFDMVVVPNTDHQLAISPYAIRRQWDYFVRNLLGAEPPADYRFRLPGER